MATISTDTFFDDGTRTSGETWTINNGATLTIRTDTRWHAGAPAGMTGVIGPINGSTTDGATLKIDATQVRWMPFDSGADTVPAIGTTITQGGVSGYLLGVWPSYTSAPLTPGSAMPTSGFLKFREITGGQFSVGALSGITASATESDRAGWIEFACKESMTSNLQQLGSLITRGDWFYIDTLTNGSAHQIVQLPTNGAGGRNNYYAVQIETAPGSGVFKWWHGLVDPADSGQDMLYRADLVGTGERSRYFKSLTDGSIQLGGNGTTLIGYVPPAGCKIRIPNIITRYNASSSAADNNFIYANASSSIYSFSNNIKKIDLQFISLCFNMNTYTGVGELIIDNSAIYPLTSSGKIDNIRKTLNITNSSFNRMSGYGTMDGVFRVSNTDVNSYIANVFMTDGRNIGSGGYGNGALSSANITMENVESNMITTWPTEQAGMRFQRLKNCVFNNLEVTGNEIQVLECLDMQMNNLDFCVRVAGPLTGSQSNRNTVFNITSCGNLTINGLTFGKNGVFSGLHPYGDIVRIESTAGPVYIRNFGTRNTPLEISGNSSYYSNSLAVLVDNVSDVKIQRCYLTNLRGSQIINFNTAASTVNNEINNVHCDNYTKTVVVTSKNLKIKGISGTTDSQADGYYGLHFCDFFTSDTEGALVWYGMDSSNRTAGENYIYSPTGNSFYLSASAQVILKDIGDYFYSEMTHFVKGHTSFKNLAPTLTGSNFSLVSLQYQIDTGSGWNGTWKALTAANLITETISPSTGFKMKFMGTKVSAGTSTLTSIKIYTYTSIEAQANNLYTLDTAKLSFTGLIPGSEVRCYAGTDPATAVEVGGTEGTGGSTFSLDHSVAGQDGYIVILAMGYQPVYLQYTYKSVDDSILIQPVVDRNYANPI